MTLAPRTSLAVAIALWMTSTATAQPSLDTTVEPTTITVGDPIRLLVTVTHKPDETVSWPEPPNVAPFEVTAQQAQPAARPDDSTVSLLQLELTAFELGALEIPSFEVVISGASGEPVTLTTGAQRVTVASVGLDESGNIRDIKAPIGIPFDPLTLVPWALGLAVMIALAVWLSRRYGRREARAPVALPPVPPRPPHEVAYESLAALEASGVLELGEVKTFHIRGSDIVRIYLQGRFGIDAMEMTTAEVLDQLTHQDVGTQTRSELRLLLERCDLVKFAKLCPEQATSRSLISQARGVVDATRPAEPAPATLPAQERGAA